MDLLPIADSTSSSFSALRSRLTPEQASDALHRRHARWLTPFRRRHLRSLAQIFVPYHLFRVEIADGRRHQTAHFAIDAVSGTLDLYRVEDGVAGLDLVPSRSANRLAATLDIWAAWPLLEHQLQRMLFQTGFFRLRNPRVSGQAESIDLHVPYWVGFYADGPHVRLEVLDAVRGRFEGAKARALVETWLAG